MKFIILIINSSGSKRIYLVRGRIETKDNEEQYDTFALRFFFILVLSIYKTRQGWIAITPLSWRMDLNNNSWTTQLQSWFVK